MRLRLIYDKELAAACIFACVSHGQHTALMLRSICCSFAFDGIAGTACSIADRTSALRYEARNYTVK
ncbi:hypothetical protein D3C73_1609820 [compost metagenome]